MILTSKELYDRAQVDQVERCLVGMERNGFKLDVGFCQEAEGRARTQEQECLGRLSDWLTEVGCSDLAAEFNWASPKQLTGLLHDRLKLPPSPVWKKGRVRIDDGERKTDEASLDWIQLQLEPGDPRSTGISELVRLRRLRGAVKYLAKLPGFVASDGMVHPVCGPAGDQDERAGTITWRLASKNPEIQQIPSDPKKDWFRIRRAFIAPEDYGVLVADESALEVVILGHLFIRLFNDHQLAEMVAPGAPDIHSVNARRVFGVFLGWERHGRPVADFPLECFKSDDYPELVQLRQDIKAVWYGLMYGKSAYGFATSLRDNRGRPIGESAAQKIVDAIYAALPALPRYGQFVYDYIVRHHGIPGLGGAWCDLSDLTKSGDRWKLARAQRIAQNYPMQEGGARIIGAAMVGISADPVLLREGLLLERQIHDELDFRYPKSANVSLIKERVNFHMCSYPLDSHLQVKMGTGENWDNAKH